MSRLPEARLLPADATGLPGWCDRFLQDPEAGEFFASRLWYDTLLAHALPRGAEPVLARGGDCLLLPMLRAGGRLGALTSPYALDWQPLPARGAEDAALASAAQAIGRLWRFGPPVRLELLDPEAPALAPLLAGCAAARLRPLRYRHTGNWHEALAPGTGWEGYLAKRPSVLRSTIARKLARAGRDADFEPVAAPGAALEAGIAAYESVRARSWKPDEPFPDFDGALMRAVAARGLLRLGVLRRRSDGAPIAAQYWVLDRGRRRATVLKLAHAEGERAASPGTVLTALMIRLLLAEDGVQELDFGRGDDEYKRLWVGERRQRIGVLLCDPLHPAGLAAILRQAAGRLRGRLRPGGSEAAG